MEGLEISVINIQDLERTARIDSQFYSKTNLTLEKLLQQIQAIPLNAHVKVSDGNHMGVSDYFCEEGVPYYRGQDMHSFFIESASPVYIPKSIYDQPLLHRSYLKQGDVILSIVGTIGSVAIASTDIPKTCSCKLAILRPESTSDTAIIACYLASKFGQLQIKRLIRGGLQMGLILEDFDQILIPCFGQNLKDKVQMLVQKAYDISYRMHREYDENIENWLSIIGFDGWFPKDERLAQKCSPLHKEWVGGMPSTSNQNMTNSSRSSLLAP